MAKHTRKHQRRPRLQQTRTRVKKQIINTLKKVGSTVYTRTKQSIPAIRTTATQLKNMAYSGLSAVTPVIENAAKKTLNTIDYGVERGIKIIKKRK